VPEEIVFLTFTSIVAVTTIAFGIMRSINKHLDRKWQAQQGGPGHEPILGELEELRTRLEGSDELRDRVVELEERVDFAERILTEGKGPDELRSGSS
jgi:hypothetical protein